MENTKAKAQTTTATKNESKPIKPKKVDLNEYITVRNGFQGKLVYKSNRTNEKFGWTAFGDEQQMELRELVNAKNSAKGFFSNNWFMFDEDWVIDYLGVRKYYKNAVKIEDFDGIFQKPAAELKEIIANMSEGQRKSAAYRARELINDGVIDSRKAIAVLEEAFGIELIEK